MRKVTQYRFVFVMLMGLSSLLGAAENPAPWGSTTLQDRSYTPQKVV
jgi:hypothetical protein